MAASSCPKCDGTTFEMKEYAPRGSSFKYNFVQCASCGAVVGVVEYWNLGSIL